MAKKQVPLPENIILPNGKKRQIYRDADGNFISKSQYDKLKANQTLRTITPGSEMEDSDRFEIPAANQLRITIPLPSLLPVEEFFSDVGSRFEAVDSLYSIFALIHFNQASAVENLTSSLKENEKQAKSEIHRYLLDSEITPLQIKRFHYGSDLVTDVLGIGKVFEAIISLRERWRKLPLEEKLLQQESELKDEEIRTKRAERQKIEIQNVQAVLGVLKEGKGLQLSDQAVEDLTEQLRIIANPLIVPLLEPRNKTFDSTNDNSESNLTSHPVNKKQRMQNATNPQTLKSTIGHLSYKGAILQGAQFAGHDLRYADFTQADLARANLHGAQLQGVKLIEANLEFADLHNAKLEQANLNSAILIEANLRGADLSEADLSNADLRKADLRDADLTNADLSRANLKGAHVTQEQLHTVKSLTGTIMPVKH